MRKKTTDSPKPAETETTKKTTSRKPKAETTAAETAPTTAAKKAPAKKVAEPTPAKPTRAKKAVEPDSAPVTKPAAKATTTKAVKPATKSAPKRVAIADDVADLKPVFRAKAAGPADQKGPESAPTDVKKGKKPEALKSLAEWVEEEKKNPRQKERKAARPKAAEPEPEPVSVVERPSNEGRGRGERGDRPRGRDRGPKQGGMPPRQAETPSLEGLESETIEDVLVYWRAFEAKAPAAGASDDDSAGRSRRRRRRGKGGVSEDERPRVEKRIVDAEPLDMDAVAEAGLEIAFRKRDGSVTAVVGTDAQPSEPRERRGRGREPKPREPRATAPKVVVPEPEPIPASPVRPSIPVPADAPHIAMRRGVPTLVRNQRVYPPLAFFASAPDEKRAQTVFAEIRRAVDAGVHIHSILVDFEVDQKSLDSAVSFAAYMLAKIVEIDPDAQLVFRIVFAAARGWEDRYANARYLTEQGRLAEPSVADDEFWGDAKSLLKEFITRIRSLELKDHILGLHLDRGEWFFPEGVGYDNSSAATDAFRNWLRLRYVNDLVALRAAWFDGVVDFKNVQVPAYQSNPTGANFMRTSRKDRRWVDYHLFLSDSIVSRIADLAYAAKEASEGYFLVGASYGYTFEWSHPASGHLSLGKLLRTREIDFIAGPPSYRDREPGGAAPFPCPVDSLPLNGKLYLSEDDFKTSIGDTKEPDDYNPVIRTPQALESVHWRGVGAALAHGSGAFWMDLWGNGWLNTATIWDRGRTAIENLVTRMGANQTDPDVAVFIDERALAYLVDERSFALLVQNVRESVLRSGLSAGFYLLSDLAHRENFPECKLYVFLNAWDIRTEHRLAIKNRLQKDGKVLFWLYCAGMFDNGRESLERAREVSGIAIKPQPFHSKTGTTILNRRHPLTEAFAGQGLIGGSNVEPSYFAIPENAVVLGEYSQSGLPSLVVRENNEDPDPSKRWISVFFGEPVVTPALMRGLAQMAGAHIWNYQSDVVHVRPPFLTVHCTGAGQRTIVLPKNWSAFNLNRNQWESEDSNSVRFQALDGSTHLFLVGVREDIEAIRSADPDELLKYMEAPAQFHESQAGDAMVFDVPIMRLDEIIEGIPEDVADDWLFKPAAIEQVEAEPEEEDRVGRRRRRTRGGRGRDRERSAGERTTIAVDDDLGMNIMFRKRE